MMILFCNDLVKLLFLFVQYFLLTLKDSKILKVLYNSPIIGILHS
jgi:hypothetical protein